MDTGSLFPCPKGDKKNHHDRPQQKKEGKNKTVQLANMLL